MEQRGGRREARQAPARVLHHSSNSSHYRRARERQGAGHRRFAGPGGHRADQAAPQHIHISNTRAAGAVGGRATPQGHPSAPHQTAVQGATGCCMHAHACVGDSLLTLAYCVPELC